MTAVSPQSVQEHHQPVGLNLVVDVGHGIAHQPRIPFGELAHVPSGKHELPLDQGGGRATRRGGFPHRPAQRQGQIVRALPALLRILGETGADHAVETRRREWHELEHGARLVLHDRGDQRGRRRALVGAPPGGHLVEHAAQCPQVAARVGLAALELLGRHVVAGADERALGREWRCDRRRLRHRPRPGTGRAQHAAPAAFAGEPEVHELGPRFRKHHIAGL